MPPIKALLLAASSSAFMLASQPLLAHSDEYLDTQKGANGGQLRMAGPYHFELVVASDNREARDSAVVVHVTDHAGAKIATAGATGTATILAGKEKSTATLTAAGDNRMQGGAKYASSPDMKVVVSITLAGKSGRAGAFYAPGGE